MTELEKAAKENVENHQNSKMSYPEWDGVDVYDSFIAGAQWQAKQSPWISVEDALPKETAKGLAKVKYLDGSEGEMLMGHISKWVYPYIKAGYVTHWCPIPE